MTKTIGLAILVFSLANVASTKTPKPAPPPPPCTSHSATSTALCAPEMDRDSAMVGLTMLLSGVAVILGRRASNSNG
jgi:hypothetical protein